LKKAFTMIELIFVIVVIGILAALAMSKLTSTRDDAKASVAIYNLKTCIVDISNHYTSTKEESTGTAADGSDSFASCKSVKDDAAFAISGVQNSGSDGNFTVANGSSTETWATMAQASAAKKGLVKTYSVGGAHVTE